MPEPKRKIRDILNEGQEVVQDQTPANRGDVSEQDPVLVPTSLRLPQPLIDRLNRASFEQKAARKRPQTRQDIIIEALGQWLDRYEQRKKLINK